MKLGKKDKSHQPSYSSFVTHSHAPSHPSLKNHVMNLFFFSYFFFITPPKHPPLPHSLLSYSSSHPRQPHGKVHHARRDREHAPEKWREEHDSSHHHEPDPAQLFHTALISLSLFLHLRLPPW